MMATVQSYFDMATELAESAPQQANLLRHLLLQREMMEKGDICEQLQISVANFPILIAKLRDRGVEVISKRTHAEGKPGVDVRYVYGVNTAEVEDWAFERRKSVLTAWDRATKVFERHLFALDLPVSEVYKILGVMEFVTKTLKEIELDASVKADQRRVEIAAEAAEAAATTLTLFA